MEVISQRTTMSSSLNAPSIIPIAYLQVEDFSGQWWELVNSSSWFQNYWLQECFKDPELNQNGDVDNDDSIFLPEIESVFDGYSSKQCDPCAGYRDSIVLVQAMWKYPGTRIKVPLFLHGNPCLAPDSGADLSEN
ncbi:hypothetical protein ACHQM5_000624 [Ranunculus cassubicifolius]